MHLSKVLRGAKGVAYRPESGLLKKVCTLYKVDKLDRAEEGSGRVAWGGVDGL